MTHIFTYGSLMFDQVWQQIVSRPYASKAYELRGFLRQSLRHADYPAAIPQPGSSITGRLYINVIKEDIERLDRFEGSEYLREHIAVEPEDGNSSEVAIYLLKPCHYHLLANKPWNERVFLQETVQPFIDNFSGFKRLKRYLSRLKIPENPPFSHDLQITIFLKP